MCCLFVRQAYDGHMNLILSDVEETIMLVDAAEGALPSQGVISVRRLPCLIASITLPLPLTDILLADG